MGVSATPPVGQEQDWVNIADFAAAVGAPEYAVRMAYQALRLGNWTPLRDRRKLLYYLGYKQRVVDQIAGLGPAAGYTHP